MDCERVEWKKSSAVFECVAVLGDVGEVKSVPAVETGKADFG